MKKAAHLILKTRLYLIIAGGGLLFLLCLAIYEFRFRLPVGSGSAGPPVNLAWFQKTWSTQDVLLVGLGDSVTAGFGASPGKSYFDRLVRNTPDEFSDANGACLKSVLPNLQLTNLAMSGSTSIHHLKTQIQKLAKLNAGSFAIIVITTGGNDLIHDYGQTRPREGAMYGATAMQAKPWVDNFEKRLDEMTKQFETSFPHGWELFIANIYDPTDGVGDPERVGLPKWRDNQALLRAYNGVIVDFAQTHSNVHEVNIHDAFLGHGIHCREFWRKAYCENDPHYWYNENLEDPNDRGYDALRRLFLLRMAEVFKGGIDSRSATK